MAHLILRALKKADLQFGLGLSAAAGWNQTIVDWQRALALDVGASFIASLDGSDVGTVTSVAFGPIAWVGLMLVDARVRGRGVGRALMERALATLDARGVRSVRLDATPLGRPLYEKLGFRLDYLLHRYAGTPLADQAPRGDQLLACRPFTKHDLERAAALDEQVAGVPRSPLLEALWRERPQGALVAIDGAGDRPHDGPSGSLRGFVLQRAGRLGTLIGPCLGDSTAGELLLAASLDQLSGSSVLVDIPERHAAAIRLATSRGLAPVRPLARMTRGPEVRDDVDRLWASSGPEKG